VLGVVLDVDVVADVGLVDAEVMVVVVVEVSPVGTDVGGEVPTVVGVAVGALGLSGDVQLEGGTPEPD
jgi:hypothetical protein